MVGDLLAAAPTTAVAAACVHDLLEGAGEGVGYKAALGTTWHHCISTRLTMHKVKVGWGVGGVGGGGSGAGLGLGMGVGSGVGGSEGEGEEGVLRLTKSPLVAVSQWRFDICAAGVRAL
jgi:hypothetical protein